MNFKDVIAGWLNPDEVQSVNWEKFAEVLRSSDHSRRLVSAEGYLKKAETDGFILFSESPLTDEWLKIPVSRVSELVYFGQESLNDGACGRVRLTV